MNKTITLVLLHLKYHFHIRLCHKKIFVNIILNILQNQECNKEFSSSLSRRGKDGMGRGLATREEADEPEGGQKDSRSEAMEGWTKMRRGRRKDEVWQEGGRWGKIREEEDAPPLMAAEYFLMRSL